MAMSVFRLGREPIFPDPELADPCGLLAIGGDLSIERLVAAYAKGIFPWYTEDTPILWWSTNPRPVLEPERLHVSGSLKRVLNRKRFHITLDRSFDRVIEACAAVPRPGQDGTWLVPEMVDAYKRLHRAGLAHSVEAWQGGELAGGLYGVSLGRVFYGESMFRRAPDASKVAFVHLARLLARWEFHLIDCQQTTDHVQRFGAHEIPRREFNVRLKKALMLPTRKGQWEWPEEM